MFSGFDAREPRPTTRRRWQYAGALVAAASGEREQDAEEHGCGGARRHPARGEAHGSGGAARRRGRPGRDAAAPALRVPDPQAALRPLHAGDGRAGLRHPGRAVPAGGRAARATTPGRERTTRLRLLASAGPITPSASSTSAAASILQTLLGNIGRPGGGILALRGHASIQGSTDIPTLFNILPGYIPMPHAETAHGLDDYVEHESADTGYWGQHARLPGQPAQGVVGRRRHGGQRLLLRLPPAAHRRPRHLPDRAGADRRAVQGLLRCSARTRRSGRPTAGCSAWAWPTSTGSSCGTSSSSRPPRSGRTGRRSRPASCPRRTSAPRCSSCPPRRTPRRTAPSPTPSGCCSGTTRPSNRSATSAATLWFIFHLGRRIREKLAGSTDERDRPVLDLTWDYPTQGAHDDPSAEAVLAEINGWDADGKPLSSYLELQAPTARRRAAAGSTAAATPTGSTRPPAAGRARSRAGWRPSGAGRGPPTGASSTTGPRPTRTARRGASARPTCWWDGEQGKWTGHDVPDFAADQGRPTTAARGRDGRGRARWHRPVHHAGRRQGVAVRARRAHGRAAARALRAAGVAGRQPALPAAAQPGAADRGGPPRRPLRAERPRAGRGRLPLRRHHLPAHRAPHRGRHEPLVALPRRAAAGARSARSPPRSPPSAAWRTATGPRSSARAARSRPG